MLINITKNGDSNLTCFLFFRQSFWDPSGIWHVHSSQEPPRLRLASGKANCTCGSWLASTCCWTESRELPDRCFLQRILNALVRFLTAFSSQARAILEWLLEESSGGSLLWSRWDLDEPFESLVVDEQRVPSQFLSAFWQRSWIACK